MTIRRERQNQLYRLLQIICRDIEFRCDLAEIIYNALNDVSTTTQLNQIIIALKNNVDEWRKYYGDLQKQEKGNTL